MTTLADGPRLFFPTPAEQRAKMVLDDDFAAANARYQGLTVRNVAFGVQLANEIAAILSAGNVPGAKRRFAEGLALMEEIETTYFTVRDLQRALHDYGDRGGIVDFLYAG
jgi:hypothetical protein